MHEYAFMQEIINTILAQIPGDSSGQITEVVLKVGVFEVHSEAAARQAFEVLAQGTPLEQSRLTLTLIQPRYECRSCGYAAPFVIGHHHHHEPLPVAECPQCRTLAPLTGGRGVEAIDLVVDDAGVAPSR
jgi:Zn finger protein HypA/HybF involved in hydrogenase expression